LAQVLADRVMNALADAPAADLERRRADRAGLGDIAAQRLRIWPKAIGLKPQGGTRRPFLNTRQSDRVGMNAGQNHVADRQIRPLAIAARNAFPSAKPPPGRSQPRRYFDRKAEICDRVLVRPRYAQTRRRQFQSTQQQLLFGNTRIRRRDGERREQFPPE
jgi:hypothetical protein